MESVVNKRRRDLLKVDLHLHTAEDPCEPIPHTSQQLIDKACFLGFDALCITNHNAITYTKYLQDYARERGILLIPGVEIDVRRKHVLVVNAHNDVLDARTFDDLRRLRRPDNLIVAPHPYFPGLASLLWMTRRHVDLFDAIEFSWFYNSHINFNMFAVRTAVRYGLPLVCTSDCHRLERFGATYSLVEAEKDPEAIIDAVKTGRVEIAANPLKLVDFGKHGIEHVFDNTVRMVWNLLTGNG